MKDKKIVLFDGVCNFCNFWVRFIYKFNTKKDILFMPLQDKRAGCLLPKSMNPSQLSSVIYYRKGELFTHSTAALKIGSELNLFVKIMSKVLMLVPSKFRDRIYNYIGKRRYNWFGKKNDCPTPSLELRKQFL